MLFQIPELDDLDWAVCGEIDVLRDRLDSQPVATWIRPLWSGRLWRMMVAHAMSRSSTNGGHEGPSMKALDACTLASSAEADYRRAMSLVLSMAEDASFAFSIDVFKHIHETVMHYDAERRPGCLRRSAVSVRPAAAPESWYTPPAAGDVPILLSELADELNRVADDVPLYVRAAVAHLNFGEIHAFADGNGRTARCLHTLVLARGGCRSSAFCSLDDYLGQYTQLQSDLMKYVSGGSWDPSRNTRHWVRFCLRGHLSQANALRDRVERMHALSTLVEEALAARGVSMFVAPLVIDAACGAHIVACDFAEMRDVGKVVASAHLDAAVVAGLLECRGSGRRQRYVASATLERMTAEAMLPAGEFDDPYAGTDTGQLLDALCRPTAEFWRLQERSRDADIPVVQQVKEREL